MTPTVLELVLGRVMVPVELTMLLVMVPAVKFPLASRFTMILMWQPVRCIGEVRPGGHIRSCDSAHGADDGGPLRAGDIACERAGEIRGAARRRSVRGSGGVPVTLPVRLPLKVPVVVPPRVRSLASWLLPTLLAARLAPVSPVMPVDPSHPRE